MAEPNARSQPANTDTADERVEVSNATADVSSSSTDTSLGLESLTVNTSLSKPAQGQSTAPSNQLGPSTNPTTASPSAAAADAPAHAPAHTLPQMRALPSFQPLPPPLPQARTDPEPCAHTSCVELVPFIPRLEPQYGRRSQESVGPRLCLVHEGELWHSVRRMYQEWRWQQGVLSEASEDEVGSEGGSSEVSEDELESEGFSSEASEDEVGSEGVSSEDSEDEVGNDELETPSPLTL